MKHLFSGIHIISDFYEISQIINDEELLNIICETCKKNNLTLLDSGIYTFENGGFTLFCLLAESHISIHYYIEDQAAFIDIFTCGQNDPSVILDELKCYCKPSHDKTCWIKRGKNNV